MGDDEEREVEAAKQEIHELESVTIEGEPVDDPEEYKGERLPDAPDGNE